MWEVISNRNPYQYEINHVVGPLLARQTQLQFWEVRAHYNICIFITLISVDTMVLCHDWEDEYFFFFLCEPLSGSILAFKFLL